MDNEELIERLKVDKSNLVFVENIHHMAFPCCICEHSSLPEGNETCTNCDHSN
jgi:hypothetical protein